MVGGGMPSVAWVPRSQAANVGRRGVRCAMCIIAYQHPSTHAHAPHLHGRGGNLLVRLPLAAHAPQVFDTRLVCFWKAGLRKSGLRAPDSVDLVDRDT